MFGLNWLESYGKSRGYHKFWAFSWAGFFVMASVSILAITLSFMLQKLSDSSGYVN